MLIFFRKNLASYKNRAFSIQIIEESGCVPPCKITDNQVQLKGIVSIPRKRDLHSDVDMEIHIYNKKAYKVCKQHPLT